MEAVKRAIRSVLPQSVLNWREMGYYARYGEIEMHLVEFLCRRNQDAIDVGANYGGYVHFMRRYAKRVVAFEPIPEFVQVLQRKFGNALDIRPIALSNITGSAKLSIPVIDGVTVGGCATVSAEAAACYETHRLIDVRLDRLDEVYEGAVGFIKIDVEGHEQAVLDGASQTIARCLPRLLVEIQERMALGGLSRAKTFFAQFGYRGYYVHARRLQRIEQFSPSALQDPTNIPSLTASLRKRPPTNYVDNFIFLPPNEPFQTVDKITARLDRL